MFISRQTQVYAVLFPKSSSLEAPDILLYPRSSCFSDILMVLIHYFISTVMRAREMRTAKRKESTERQKKIRDRREKNEMLGCGKEGREKD